MLDNPFREEIVPNIQSKPPLAQLEAIFSRPITCYLGEETDPHLSTTSFQAVVESNKVSPQPPFLQANYVVLKKQASQCFILMMNMDWTETLCPKSEESASDVARAENWGVPWEQAGRTHDVPGSLGSSCHPSPATAIPPWEAAGPPPAVSRLMSLQQQQAAAHDPSIA
ncbi:hypothetical protein QYF61_001796 [Mycteria americana]|uniref:Uncharacterized protein n=1 Tax=Mycteria americana TaxID=33587 RepID=A0AAN7SGI3_MYCAM|nr:hypothetical protein QYF61_001796 [Mycteria americana]